MNNPDVTEKLRAPATSAPASGSADSWQDIKTAPRNATWVQVKMRDGTVQRAHWASDLSGEDQPPFEGWFVDRKTYMLGIFEPVAWRPCPPNTEVSEVAVADSTKTSGVRPPLSLD